MPMVLIETLPEFAERQGGNPVPHYSGYLYPSGAWASRDDLIRREPPTDEFGRLKTIREYWLKRSETLETDFKRWHGAMTGRYSPIHVSTLQTPGVDRVQGDEVALLAFLATNLREARSELSRVENILTPNPTPVDAEQARQRQAEVEQAQGELDRQRYQRDMEIARIVASVNEPTDPTPVDPRSGGFADPTAPRATPGRAVTLASDPYDLTEPDVPE